jgi:ring-1,2-phenylacetyl-CoA epoxidase subunit PaaD
VVNAALKKPAAVARSADSALAGLEARPALGALWKVAAAVPDPEIPVISVTELGILRGLEWDERDPVTLVVSVTPTYSGCPATDVIMASLREALMAAGAANVRIETRLSPAWTTDWMTPEGKRKLAEFGIAPPGAARASAVAAMIDASRILPLRRAVSAIACPRCQSKRTELLSQFGSTACKAHYRCLDCLEPFDYFKPH